MSYLSELKPWRFPHCKDEILVLSLQELFCLKKHASSLTRASRDNQHLIFWLSCSFGTLVKSITKWAGWYESTVRSRLTLYNLILVVTLSLPFETTHVEKYKVRLLPQGHPTSVKRTCHSLRTWC